MDVTEKWGDDVESAVNLALADLKLERDQVDITVLEEPSKGFFGIGSKLALVRVEKKKTSNEKAREKVEAPEKKAAEIKPAVKETIRPAKAEERKPAKTNDKPAQEMPRSRHDELDFHKDMDKLPVCESHPAMSFLKEVTEQMGLDLDMVARADDNNVYIDIQGEDSGTIIGKRGQTLDAIQYLTSLVVNKGHDNYVKVVVDAENYRSKRERTLEQLANKLASKVIKTKRSVKLEPMNPYERKVIHATLQDNSRVTTRSEGQDPYRRVIIELK